MFLLDSNVFITAFRSYYAFHFTSGFWDWLKGQHFAGNIASVQNVRHEITQKHDDRLATWVKALPRSFWLSPNDEPTLAAMSKLASWTQTAKPGFREAAIQKFFSDADSFLIAQASSHEHIVVTFERPAPNAEKRVFIPDACAAIGVEYADPFAVYQRLGLRFTGPAPNESLTPAADTSSPPLPLE